MAMASIICHMGSVLALATTVVALRPVATVTGPPVYVYNWRTDHCPGLRGELESGGRCPNDVQLGCDPDVPDAPLKAFRNASGTVVLLAPVDLGARSLVGPSLAAVRHDCHVYMNSTLDYDMADSACREWNQSPYAFPNGSIFALTHMEYHNHSNQMGLWSSVTLLTSTDGGRRWAHALAPPHHIVAAAPYRYAPSGPDSVLFGFRSPSNIIRSRADDGYFYAFVTAGWGRLTANPIGQQPGACLMRSRDITSPSSWRAWDGSDFNVSLAVNPYLEDDLDPSQHICRPITTMTYISILWSRVFNSYIVFGTTLGNDHIGWSFQLIQDLAQPQRIGPQVAVDTDAYITPGGNASVRAVHLPVPGMWARSLNTTSGALGTAIWWISEGNASKHAVHSCEPCGVNACNQSTLRAVPTSTLAAIVEGIAFDCDMIGGGGEGVSAYLYPSLIDESCADANFEEVGETASLFLVTSDCRTWTNVSGVVECNPFDSDGKLSRSVVKLPVRFSLNISSSDVVEAGD